ncbi:hypothetical protein G7Y89_g14144 [Cudoniella acicularis]|uniref:Amino acid transporter transmembrane domain-containing protein n=1 Tax=Cudoniella acicularis TaxID=354080 RepID=A0A8H4R663_9HELO|nr:hypothetical protein G7Y89_g14144 [Cudoniella acicularis]
MMVQFLNLALIALSSASLITELNQAHISYWDHSGCNGGACVFAQKLEWLRNACLAAALLFPAVAALHGITLAAVHVDGAIDMDVYGAFQLYSIGIMVAPVIPNLSRKYFYDPGRNTIFIWTVLILAGLLSLTIEFSRATTSYCTHDELGTPISSDPGDFTYNTTCSLTCSTGQGPFSPLRGGSQKDIYTLEIYGKAHFNNNAEEEEVNEPIERTNSSTFANTGKIKNLAMLTFNRVEILLVGATTLVIFIVGELNFFSPQVRYQTESLSSIRSLYLLLVPDLQHARQEANRNPSVPSQSIAYLLGCHRLLAAPLVNLGQCAPIVGTAIAVLLLYFLLVADLRVVEDAANRSSSVQAKLIALVTGYRSTPPGLVSSDESNRPRFAVTLNAFGSYISNSPQDKIDNSEFKRGKALDFPGIIGEEYRKRPRKRGLYQQVMKGNVKMAERSSLVLQKADSPSSTASTRHGLQQRRDTIEVPLPDHHNDKLDEHSPPVNEQKVNFDAIPPQSRERPLLSLRGTTHRYLVQVIQLSGQFSDHITALRRPPPQAGKTRIE